jgi:hypothetical protein
MSKRSAKLIAIKITATLYVEESMVFDFDTLAHDLTEEDIKVKSGIYENLAIGDIDTVVSVEYMPRQDGGKA